MPPTEGQSLSLTDTLKLAVTVKLTATLSRISTNQFPWDEALLEHRHLGQTSSLGTKLSQSIDTWDTLTETTPLTVTVTMLLTEGQSLKLAVLQLTVLQFYYLATISYTSRKQKIATVKLTATLLLINTNQFPWDEALLEHRHLGQTGSLGTKLF